MALTNAQHQAHFKMRQKTDVTTAQELRDYITARMEIYECELRTATGWRKGFIEKMLDLGNSELAKVEKRLALES